MQTVEVCGLMKVTNGTPTHNLLVRKQTLSHLPVH